jgi:hypothetical protein
MTYLFKHKDSFTFIFTLLRSGANRTSALYYVDITHSCVKVIQQNDVVYSVTHLLLRDVKVGKVLH